MLILQVLSSNYYKFINPLIAVIILLLNFDSFTGENIYTENILNAHIITESDTQYIIEGSNFSITCEILRYTLTTTPLKVEWYHRNKSIIQSEHRWHETNETLDDSYITATLTIIESKKYTDRGEYECIVIDDEYNIRTDTIIQIIGHDEVYTYFDESLNTHTIDVKRGTRIIFGIYLDKVPKSNIQWFEPDGQEIASNNKLKFEIRTDYNKSILIIENSQVIDSGVYQILAVNKSISYKETLAYFKVLIRSEPFVYLMPRHYVGINQFIYLECLVDSHPKPNISWTFIPCLCCNEENWSLKCYEENAIIITDMAKTFKDETIFYKSILEFVVEDPGKIICSANNAISETIKESQIFTPTPTTSVFKPSFYIKTPYYADEIIVGDPIVLTCVALSAYNYTNAINWYKNGLLVNTTKDIKIFEERTLYSFNRILSIKKIKHDHAGTYECRGLDIEQNIRKRSTIVKIFDPVGPIFSNNSIENNTIIYKTLNEAVELRCKVIASIPKLIEIKWFKDNQPIVEDDNIQFENDTTSILIKKLHGNYNDNTFKCEISNRVKVVHRSTKIKITDILYSFTWTEVIGIPIIFLAAVSIIIFICVYKNAQIKKQLKNLGITNFQEGCVNQINVSMTLDEQAELLPYDRNRFEFSKDKIKFYKPLGEGAFGIVYKAQCKGILPNEKESIVAVKMVKKSADNEVIRALVSELKIMVHLGQHLNVVNLLGAVTKNIFKRELMVIVEYCRYGNIQDLLLKSREKFINQIDPKTDLINPTITSSNPDEINKFQRFQTDHNLQSSNIITDPQRHSVQETGENYGDFHCQPAWRSNYESDEFSYTLNITTSNLISWIFQITRGMDYLVSRKVLHGDLAARNILLCEDNVVKICDFGLARFIYKKGNYQQNEKAKLPIKWLALESLGERIFSTQTDVWSFGIVMWEIFSLAKVPYAGVNPFKLYELLKSGYRMEKPIFANQKLYNIMLECWNEDPDSRPLFDELETRIGQLLETNITNHYINLNEPYLRINIAHRKSSNTKDWTTLLRSPSKKLPKDIKRNYPESSMNVKD